MSVFKGRRRVHAGPDASLGPSLAAQHVESGVHAVPPVPRRQTLPSGVRNSGTESASTQTLAAFMDKVDAAQEHARVAVSTWHSQQRSNEAIWEKIRLKAPLTETFSARRLELQQALRDARAGAPTSAVPAPKMPSPEILGLEDELDDLEIHLARHTEEVQKLHRRLGAREHDLLVSQLQVKSTEAVVRRLSDELPDLDMDALRAFADPSQAYLHDNAADVDPLRSALKAALDRVLSTFPATSRGVEDALSAMNTLTRGLLQLSTGQPTVAATALHMLSEIPLSDWALASPAELLQQWQSARSETIPDLDSAVHVAQNLARLMAIAPESMQLLEQMSPDHNNEVISTPRQRQAIQVMLATAAARSEDSPYRSQGVEILGVSLPWLESAKRGALAELQSPGQATSTTPPRRTERQTLSDPAVADRRAFERAWLDIQEGGVARGNASPRLERHSLTWVERIRRYLAVQSTSTQKGPFHARTTARPTQAKPPWSAGALAKQTSPVTAESLQNAPSSQIRATRRAANGYQPDGASGASLSGLAHDHVVAATQWIRSVWGATRTADESTALNALVNNIHHTVKTAWDHAVHQGLALPMSTQMTQQTCNDAAMLLGNALSIVAEGDGVDRVARAQAILRAVCRAEGDRAGNDGTDASAEQIAGGAWAVHRHLAKTRPGFEVLKVLQAEVQLSTLASGAQGDKEHLRRETIRDEAQWQTLRIADQLLKTLTPAQQAQLRQPEQLLMVANAVTGANVEGRGTGQGSHWVAKGGAPAQLNQRHLAHALLCAVELQKNPDAQPPAPQRSAYFAWRNGMDEVTDGSILDKTQRRLFKMNTYLERASGAEKSRGAWLSRVFGHGKSPLSGLRFGSLGALMKNPEEDFRRAESAVREICAALVDQVQGVRQSPATAEDVRKTVRVAALEEYVALQAAKGWRKKIDLGKSSRDKILKRAAQMLHIDGSVLKRSTAFSLPKRMDAQLMQDWIEAEGLLNSHPRVDWNQKLNDVQEVGRMGDKPHLTFDTPEDVLDEVKRLIGGPQVIDGQETFVGARNTFDVRYADGGSVGLAGSVLETFEKIAENMYVPVALAGPDIKAIRGRQAMVNIGSSSHGGTMFVGTDTRKSAHIGAAAVAAWSSLGNYMTLHGGMQVIPYSRDHSDPKGVMIRVRMPLTGEAARESWREKLADVADKIVRPSPEMARHDDKASMWQTLADHYYKDPDVSINWHSTRVRSTSSSAVLSGGGRASVEGYKVGPIVGAGINKTWGTEAQRRDVQGGRLKAETLSHATGRSLAAGVSLVASPSPIENQSDDNLVKQVVLPSVPVVGTSATFLTSSAGTTLRIYEDNGRIDPNLTFKDSEFGTTGGLNRLVGERYNAWVAAMGGGNEGKAAVDSYLKKTELNAQRGNSIFAERLHLDAVAAHRIDALKSLRSEVEQSTKMQKHWVDSEVKRINGEINRILADDSSWRTRVLFNMEGNQDTRSKGVGFLVQAQAQTSASHFRMTAVMPAKVAV